MTNNYYDERRFMWCGAVGIGIFKRVRFSHKRVPFNHILLLYSRVLIVVFVRSYFTRAFVNGCTSPSSRTPISSVLPIV